MQVMQRSKRSGYVAIGEYVHRVPIRVLLALEKYLENGMHDEVDETMKLIRRHPKCPLVCKLDHVLTF